MLKIIGAILIISGTLSWGINGASKLKKHIKVLEELVGSLELMKGEICSRKAAMPELLTLMKESTKGYVNSFFTGVLKKLPELGKQSFSSMWISTVQECFGAVLTEQELKTVEKLGYVLGRYDMTEQKSALLLAQRRLEMFLKKSEAEYDKDAKVRTFLGMAAGVFAVIIMI